MSVGGGRGGVGRAGGVGGAVGGGGGGAGEELDDAVLAEVMEELRLQEHELARIRGEVSCHIRKVEQQQVVSNTSVAVSGQSAICREL